MDKPVVKLYDSFSELVENRKSLAVEDIDDAKRQLKRGWYQPDKAEEESCLDVDKIPDKFPREDLQDDYLKYITEGRFPVEALSIKFQNGFIAAEEQAYRIRHTSLPRALAQGYLEDLRWSNETVPFLLTNRIKVIGDLAEQDFNNRYS
jgi:hypothetical protein